MDYNSSIAVRTFGYNSYQQLTTTAGTDNVISSPLSILFALLLTYIGAEGQTKKEIEQIIQANSSSRNAVLDGYLSIMRDLFPKTGAEQRPYELTIANNIVVDKRFNMKPSYYDQTQRYLAVKGFAEDFQNDAEGARKRINGWAATQTKNKIKEALPSGIIDRDTVMMLINVIHFKSSWLLQFEKHRTKDLSFKNLDNSQATAPMMEQTTKFKYFRNEQQGFQYLELPYEENKNSMIIILPDANKMLQDFEKVMTPEMMLSAAESATYKRVRIVLPKFKFEQQYDLKQVLKAMGIKQLFTNGADLSGISSEPTYVSKAVHKAFIDVNELGTEAAAVTTIAASSRSMKQPLHIDMVCDRPFLFAIRNNEKKVLLFSGRVAKL